MEENFLTCINLCLVQFLCNCTQKFLAPGHLTFTFPLASWHLTMQSDFFCKVTGDVPQMYHLSLPGPLGTDEISPKQKCRIPPHRRMPCPTTHGLILLLASCASVLIYFFTGLLLLVQNRCSLSKNSFDIFLLFLFGFHSAFCSLLMSFRRQLFHQFDLNRSSDSLCEIFQNLLYCIWR